MASSACAVQTFDVLRSDAPSRSGQQTNELRTGFWKVDYPERANQIDYLWHFKQSTQTDNFNIETDCLHRVDKERHLAALSH